MGGKVYKASPLNDKFSGSGEREKQISFCYIHDQMKISSKYLSLTCYLSVLLADVGVFIMLHEQSRLIIKTT